MYSMKEACKLTDMTYENLKFYCNEGLVSNVKRDKRNYRVFDDHDIKWIQSLNCLKNCGMSIENDKLEQLCESLHYSRNHLINQFRNRYQITPYQYLREQKIEAAKRYLLYSGMSIQEIAERLSYTDENYFHSCFKEATGLTPGNFRKFGSVYPTEYGQKQ